MLDVFERNGLPALHAVANGGITGLREAADQAFTCVSPGFDGARHNHVLHGTRERDFESLLFSS